MNRLLVVVWAGLVVVAGCGDEDTSVDNPVLGCQKGHSCIDFGTAFSQQEAADNCEGSVNQGSCGRSNIVGSCQVPLAGSLLTEYYYPTGWSAMTAETDCVDGGGTFTAP